MIDKTDHDAVQKAQERHPNDHFHMYMKFEVRANILGKIIEKVMHKYTKGTWKFVSFNSSSREVYNDVDGVVDSLTSDIVDAILSDEDFKEEKLDSNEYRWTYVPIQEIASSTKKVTGIEEYSIMGINSKSTKDSVDIMNDRGANDFETVTIISNHHSIVKSVTLKNFPIMFLAASMMCSLIVQAAGRIRRLNTIDGKIVKDGKKILPAHILQVFTSSWFNLNLNPFDTAMNEYPFLQTCIEDYTVASALLQTSISKDGYSRLSETDFDLNPKRILDASSKKVL